MRDPSRIDKLMDLLREAWQLRPDFRLTQLIMIISDKPQDLGTLWHIEDDTMELRLRAFIDGSKMKLKTPNHRTGGTRDDATNSQPGQAA